MSEALSTPPQFTVTPEAVSLLLELKQQYSEQLRFRIFVDDDDQLTLRVHDKEYEGDWRLDVAGVGLSFCKKTLSKRPPLTLDCNRSEHNMSGFELLLSVNQQPVTELSGDQVIARIVSRETEVCDAYGEYCYTAYI
jgi:hypothetical protein